MRPINCIIEEVRSEAPLIRTYRLDRNLNPAPGQYLMLWIRGVDEIPMSFSGPDTITVQSVGVATQAILKRGRASRASWKRLCIKGQQNPAHRRRSRNCSACVSRRSGKKSRHRRNLSPWISIQR